MNKELVKKMNSEGFEESKEKLDKKDFSDKEVNGWLTSSSEKSEEVSENPDLKKSDLNNFL